jgi:amino acid transporter
MEFGFKTGGPVVMLYGWIIVGLFTIVVGSSMSEICSTYPAAGSVYYWSGVLAPKVYAPLLSYMTGWLNLIGNVAVNASFAYGLAKILSGISALNNTDDYWQDSSIVFAAILILAIWSIKNMMRID